MARQSASSSGTVVVFGNPNPQMQNADGTARPAEHVSQSVTRVEMWPGFDDPDHADLALSTENDRVLTMIGRTLAAADKRYAIGVNELEQVVSIHTGGQSPDWISSTDEDFARVLAAHFGCPVGEPVMLLTNVGRDALHAQHLSTSAQPATFNYMALANSATATTPAVGDTTLTGEITTAGGGLIRAQATYAHTTGTNTTTLTKTFTANGTDSLPVTVSQIGVLNAASAGTLGYKTALNATATLTISGDNVAITHTLTIG